jgi:hypothetical protein
MIRPCSRYGQTMRGKSTPIPRENPIINVPLAPTFRIYDIFPPNIRNKNHWIAYASNCSAQGQANDKSGLHNVGPVTVSSGTGSCSISFSSRAGEGNVFAPKSHIIGQSAFNDPGFKTGTCASTSAGPNGLSRNFDDGQHSSDRSCSTHSP